MTSPSPRRGHLLTTLDTLDAMALRLGSLRSVAPARLGLGNPRGIRSSVPYGGGPDGCTSHPHDPPTFRADRASEVFAKRPIEADRLERAGSGLRPREPRDRSRAGDPLPALDGRGLDPV